MKKDIIALVYQIKSNVMAINIKIRKGKHLAKIVEAAIMFQMIELLAIFVKRATCVMELALKPNVLQELILKTAQVVV